MTFKVGDVCEIKYAANPANQRFVGAECSVERIGPVTAFISRESHTGYHCALADGTRFYALAAQLRLRRPPSWDSWLYDVSDVKHEASATPTPNRERVVP